MRSSKNYSVVIDAGLFLVTVFPHPYQDAVQSLWRQWVEEQRLLRAPHLWVAEVTSGLRRAVWERILTPAEAERALNRMLRLPITFIPDATLAQSALTWAGRLGQKRAYDAFYLALAERLGVKFWSTDRRLVARAHQLGATWAHWVGEYADISQE
ncbi:MAG: PIN domain-containing protein [Chloroflexi bacterium]|nr:MAG: PIN domain-containing protein [Chloroflexota bacterium]